MNRKVMKWGMAGAVAGAAIVLLDALFLEKYYFQVNTYEIGDKRSSKKIKILLLTDLHFKNKFRSFYRRLADKVNSLHPDLIVIAGDIIDMTGRPAPARKFFSLLNPSIPKAVILGNHDYKGEISVGTFKKIFNRYGCDLLLNKSKEYLIGDKRIMVTGVDDFIEGKPAFAEAVRDVGREDNHILLVHSPLQHEMVIKEIENINAKRRESEKLNIKYVFAGHNHGGQVKFFGYAPILPKKLGNYLNGWYNSEPPYLYVSRGFGTAAIPFRFGSRSEVAVFNYGV